MRGELPDKAQSPQILAAAGTGECQTHQVLMSKCVDRELEPAEAATLKTHLNQCEACRTQLKHWKEHAALMSKALNAVWQSERGRQWSVLPRTGSK